MVQLLLYESTDWNLSLPFDISHLPATKVPETGLGLRGVQTITIAWQIRNNGPSTGTFSGDAV